MSKKLKQILSFLLCFVFIFEQAGFAQVLPPASPAFSPSPGLIDTKFRPLHLRYLGLEPDSGNLNLLLDKGDAPAAQLESETAKLLDYFKIGLVLPNSSFWVNLRPDSADNIIDPLLAKTDIGKILLEADVQLKKDTALFTSPQTSQGKEYWDKIYQKAGELFGAGNISVPTLTRTWIVPNEIIVRETKDSAYIYKATLKVLLEQDYLKGKVQYSFADPRAKILNEYASELMRSLIIPRLTKDVNTAKRYASLRQVYYSLILAQWFKAKGLSPKGTVPNSKNLTGLTSSIPCKVDSYYKQYKTSVEKGEYDLSESSTNGYQQVQKRYFAGGVLLASLGSGAIQAIRGGAGKFWAGGKPQKLMNGNRPYIEEIEARQHLHALEWNESVAAQEGGMSLSIPAYAYNALDIKIGEERQTLSKVIEEGLAYNPLVAEARKELIEEDNKYNLHGSLKNYSEKVKDIGEKAGIAGSAVYYTFGGFDAHAPFMLSETITDAFIMEREKFGSPNDIMTFIKKAPISMKAGNRFGRFDLITQDISSVMLKLDLTGLGAVAIARIISFLNGRIEGLYYFDIKEDGSPAWLREDEIKKGAFNNAVILFRDPDTDKLKRCWHISHDVYRGIVRNELFRQISTEKIEELKNYLREAGYIDAQGLTQPKINEIDIMSIDHYVKYREDKVRILEILRREYQEKLRFIRFIEKLKFQTMLIKGSFDMWDIGETDAAGEGYTREGYLRLVGSKTLDEAIKNNATIISDAKGWAKSDLGPNPIWQHEPKAMPWQCKDDFGYTSNDGYIYYGPADWLIGAAAKSAVDAPAVGVQENELSVAAQEADGAIAEKIARYMTRRDFKSAQQMIRDYVLRKRSGLWVEGTIDDIKRGGYFVIYEPAYLVDKEGHDMFDMITDKDDYWFGYGLAANIHLNIGGTQVLVMDNHNYAAAFIIEMLERGIIKKSSIMNHFDAHRDMEASDFILEEYLELKTEGEKLKYLLTTTNINNWQYDLIHKYGIIDRSLYRHFSLGRILGSRQFGAMQFEGKRLSSFKEVNQKEILREADIVDIDIDVLRNIDRQLSDKQKMDVLNGEIPLSIMDEIVTLAQSAAKATVVTIATSPGFINQDRALIYIKALLQEIGAAKKEILPHGGGNTQEAGVPSFKKYDQLVSSIFKSSKSAMEEIKKVILGSGYNFAGDIISFDQIEASHEWELLKDAVEFMIENLSQREYEGSGPLIMRVYFTQTPFDGIRVEFWGPGKNKLPDLLTAKSWFASDDMPWQPERSPTEARSKNGVAGYGIGVSSIFNDLKEVERGLRMPAHKHILVGWREDNKREGFEPNGHIIALHIPVSRADNQNEGDAKGVQEARQQANKNILPPYTGSGDTSIHGALHDARAKINNGEFDSAGQLLKELLVDLADAQKADDITKLMDKWNERYPSALEVDLLLEDIPEAIEEAQGLVNKIRIQKSGFSVLSPPNREITELLSGRGELIRLPAKFRLKIAHRNRVGKDEFTLVNLGAQKGVNIIDALFGAAKRNGVNDPLVSIMGSLAYSIKNGKPDWDIVGEDIDLVLYTRDDSIMQNSVMDLAPAGITNSFLSELKKQGVEVNFAEEFSDGAFTNPATGRKYKVQLFLGNPDALVPEGDEEAFVSYRPHHLLFGDEFSLRRLNRTLSDAGPEAVLRQSELFYERWYADAQRFLNKEPEEVKKRLATISKILYQLAYLRGKEDDYSGLIEIYKKLKNNGGPVDEKDVKYVRSAFDSLAINGNKLEELRADLRKLIDVDTQESDLLVAGSGSRVSSRVEHEEFHDKGGFAKVIEKIAEEIGAELKNGRYDLRGMIEGKRQEIETPFGRRKGLLTSAGMVYIEYENGPANAGILVIMDSRFKENHAGRNEYAVYARNKYKVVHELTELRLWADLAMRYGIAPQSFIENGQLGIMLRIWMNPVGDPEMKERRKQEVKKRAEEFHRIALEAENQYRYKNGSAKFDEPMLEAELDFIIDSAAAQEDGLSPYKKNVDYAGLIEEVLSSDGTYAYTQGRFQIFGISLKNGIPPILITKHHNRAYNAWQAARIAGILPDNGDLILLNIDAHSDLLYPTRAGKVQKRPQTIGEALRQPTYDITDFIIPATLDLFSEAYYIPPDTMAVDDELDSLLEIDGENIIIKLDKGKEHINNYREWYAGPARKGNVKLSARNIDNLPDFKDESRPVVVSIDLDFIFDQENDGIGGPAELIKDKITGIIDQKIKSIGRMFRNKHIKPSLITIAFSPHTFTPAELIPEIMEKLLAELEAQGVITIERGSNNTPQAFVLEEGGHFANPAEAQEAGKVKGILLDETRRPEPEELVGFSEEDIGEGARLAFGQSGPAGLEKYKSSATLHELENSLIYIEMMVKEILARQHNYSKIMLMGRDAEIFYDALAATLSGTPERGKVVLFPASRPLLEDLSLNLNKYIAMYGKDAVREFMGRFGITENAVQGKERILVIDTGSVGTAGFRIWQIAKQLYDNDYKPSTEGAIDIRQAREKIKQMLDIFVVGKEEPSLAEELIPVIFMNREEKFPKTSQSAAGLSDNQLLAKAMQLLPHYHEVFFTLSKNQDGYLTAIPRQRGPIEENIDNLDISDDSVVNPVAAMLVQRRIIEHFRNKPQNQKTTIQKEGVQENSAVKPNDAGEKQDGRKLSGIDFRSLPIAAQPVGFRDGPQKEGIAPVVTSIRASFQKDPSEENIGQLLAQIADILRQEEESVVPTDPELKEILVFLEAGGKTPEKPGLDLANITIKPSQRGHPF